MIMIKRGIRLRVITAGKKPNEDVSYYAWKDTGETTRYRFFQLQNGNQWIGYNEIWVSNRNHS